MNKFRDVYARRNGIIVPSLPVLDLTSGTDIKGAIIAPSVSGQYQHWSTLGYFGRLNYNFKEKYLLEVNLRYDGTSRFREDKRWNLFPSVSGGWNLAREEFWSPFVNAVSLLKIRASYGKLGNQNTSNLYPTYVVMPVGTSNGAWLVNGIRPNTSSAPGLVSELMTWEKIENWNVGFDISAFNQRLESSFDYFNRYTTDMIGPAPELPVILGTAVPRMNNTDLITYGFEFMVSWRNTLKNGFNYGVKLFLSDNQSKILRYPNPTGLLSTYREGTNAR
jgi:hypothetical protein